MTIAKWLRPLHALPALLFAGLIAATPAAMAHGDAELTPAGPVKKEQKAWGIAGEAQAVKRTIAIRMADNMRFSPDNIEIRQGETVRFRHTNNGKTMHEFVLGTKAELDDHAALMKKYPNMEHDEPYMAHVPPGKQGEIVWTFNRPGEFDFACLLPGHYEAGMVGRIRVTAAAKKEKS